MTTIDADVGSITNVATTASSPNSTTAVASRQDALVRTHGFDKQIKNLTYLNDVAVVYDHATYAISATRAVPLYEQAQATGINAFLLQFFINMSINILTIGSVMLDGYIRMNMIRVKENAYQAEQEADLYEALLKFSQTKVEDLPAKHLSIYDEAQALLASYVSSLEFEDKLEKCFINRYYNGSYDQYYQSKGQLLASYKSEKNFSSLLKIILHNRLRDRAIAYYVDKYLQSDSSQKNALCLALSTYADVTKSTRERNHALAQAMAMHEAYSKLYPNKASKDLTQALFFYRDVKRLSSKKQTNAIKALSGSIGVKIDPDLKNIFEQYRSSPTKETERAYLTSLANVYDQHSAVLTLESLAHQNSQLLAKLQSISANFKSSYNRYQDQNLSQIVRHQAAVEAANIYSQYQAEKDLKEKIASFLQPTEEKIESTATLALQNNKKLCHAAEVFNAHVMIEQAIEAYFLDHRAINQQDLKQAYDKFIEYKLKTGHEKQAAKALNSLLKLIEKEKFHPENEALLRKAVDRWTIILGKKITAKSKTKALQTVIKIYQTEKSKGFKDSILDEAVAIYERAQAKTYAKAVVIPQLKPIPTIAFNIEQSKKRKSEGIKQILKEDAAILGVTAIFITGSTVALGAGILAGLTLFGYLSFLTLIGYLAGYEIRALKALSKERQAIENEINRLDDEAKKITLDGSHKHANHPEYQTYITLSHAKAYYALEAKIQKLRLRENTINRGMRWFRLGTYSTGVLFVSSLVALSIGLPLIGLAITGAILATAAVGYLAAYIRTRFFIKPKLNQEMQALRAQQPEEPVAEMRHRLAKQRRAPSPIQNNTLPAQQSAQSFTEGTSASQTAYAPGASLAPSSSGLSEMPLIEGDTQLSKPMLQKVPPAIDDIHHAPVHSVKQGTSAIEHVHAPQSSVALTELPSAGPVYNAPQH